MKGSRFAVLIKRFLAGRATKKEADSIEKWLEHRAESNLFSSVSAEEKQKIKLRTLNAIAGKIEPQKVVPIASSSSRRMTTFYRAAAAVLICVLSYAVLRLPSTPDDFRIEMKEVRCEGTQKKVILSDGSLVWLKSNSSIIYPEIFTGTKRNVELIGEALFEVSKDPAHPFVIQCGDLRAEVLGTSFNIKSSKSHIEVLVLTGKVALSSARNRENLIVHPNEKVVYHSAEDRMTKVAAKEDEQAVKIAGTEYSMSFNATAMKEVIRRIEGKFDVSFSLSDKRLNDCTITADFTDQSLDRTLKMISQSLEIEYQINNDEVLLTGEGCD